MNRRSLLLRTLMLPVSAAVFSASGWLMGTRTLSMFEAPTPPPGSGTGQSKRTCPDFCDLDCAFRIRCVNGHYFVDEWSGCTNHGCPYGWCQWYGTPNEVTC
jgi:hypothetical protein